MFHCVYNILDYFLLKVTYVKFLYKNGISMDYELACEAWSIMIIKKNPKI